MKEKYVIRARDFRHPLTPFFVSSLGHLTYDLKHAQICEGLESAFEKLKPTPSPRFSFTLLPLEQAIREQALLSAKKRLMPKKYQSNTEADCTRQPTY